MMKEKLDSIFIMQKFHVKDRLPEDGIEVLAEDIDGHIYLATYDYETKVWDAGCCYYGMNIVYWATIPKKLN